MGPRPPIRMRMAEPLRAVLMALTRSLRGDRSDDGLEGDNDAKRVELSR